MKPLFLSMSAFGPYAEKEVIDFSHLQNRKFFLIHGPTGSGKTTLLDAMCYALYGDTSGAMRSGKMMRSNYADVSIPTEILFDFAIGNTFYRVCRHPEQEYRKKRGEGTTVQKEAADLFLLDEQRQEVSVLASGATRVTEQICNLLGFKCDQFRQVVLLPQGDFRRLLTASSIERQEIMQTLFRTEVYQMIEMKLKNKADEIKKQFEELRKQVVWILQEADVQNEAELQDRLTENQQKMNLLAAQAAALQKKLQAAHEDATKGRLVQQKLMECEQATLELTNLQEKTAIVEQKRCELERSDKAAGLFDAEKNVLQLRDDVKTLLELYRKCEGSCQLADKNRVQARELAANEAAKEEERETARRRCHYLQELTGRSKELLLAQQQERLAKQEFEKMDGLRQNAAKRLQTMEMELAAHIEQREALAAIAAERAERNIALEALQTMIDKRKTLVVLQKEAKQLEQQLGQQIKSVAVLEQDYFQAKDKLDLLRTQWTNGQAAVMAHTLQKGQPCPVCGSHEHPQKAVAIGILPSEAEIKAIQIQFERIDADKLAGQLKLNSLQTAYQNLLAQAKAKEEELSADNRLLSETEAQSAVAAAQKQVAEAEAAQKKLITCDSVIHDSKEKKKQIVDEHQSLELQHQTANANWRAAQAIVCERANVVPEEYRQEMALRAAQQKADHCLKQLQEQHEAARKKAEEAEKTFSSAKTALQHTEEDLKMKNERLKQETAAFTERLTAAGFANEAVYLASRKTTGDRERLRDAIQKFDFNLAAALDRQTRLLAETQGLATPDLAGLEEKLRIIQEQYNQNSGEQGKLTDVLAREKGWLTNLSRLTLALDELEKEYEIVSVLAEVANGKGINQYGVTLQRFVLGALLDDVASAANLRLQKMSRGRYYLQRTLDRARRNSAAGLELEVFDNNTGVARNVNTLSGGETFLASLSLALGLADVVQAYSGGIRLDTMFIDEGFGSLDPETLDFAIKTLLDLQQEGRLIGIISHVPELKERIDTRLEISFTARGSKAEFKIG
ncbi:MAG: hypothetical protein H6Q66_2684 [Firmicutes bacterium]|nr:hypothetical protein [Bacillota bacterium]